MPRPDDFSRVAEQSSGAAREIGRVGGHEVVGERGGCVAPQPRLVLIWDICMSRRHRIDARSRPCSELCFCSSGAEGCTGAEMYCDEGINRAHGGCAQPVQCAACVGHDSF